MSEEDLKKKGRRSKPTSGRNGHPKRNTFPTLARIVLSNGSVVDIPKLPGNFSELTTYANMRIAMEHAALVTQWLDVLSSQKKKTLGYSPAMVNIRVNLEDLKNHLYYAIEGFHSGKGSS